MNLKLFCFVSALVAFSSTNLLAQTAAADAPQILSVKKIWDAGKHNAFTDLIRFKGKWFCTFRESEAHVGGNGQIRVLTSKDGEQWQSAALLTEEGVDLRDPKFSITPDNRLMLVLGGSIYEGKTLLGKQPRVAFSKDGQNWTAPERVLEKDDWLWRVTWHKGRAYGVAYTIPSKPAPGAKSVEWTVKFVESKDGIHYRLVTNLEVPGRPNEATVRFLKNGDCLALVRREAEDKAAWIGRSSAPYREWKWQPAGMQIGGPNFIVLPKGEMIAGGRIYNSPAVKNHQTFIGRMTPQSVSTEVILPSGGDCSYPGLVWHRNLLWMSYYSSHEERSSIYLAKVQFKK